MSGDLLGADRRQSLPRRRLLGLGLTAGLGLTLAAGCSSEGSPLPDLPGLPGGTRERPRCVARASLPRFARLADLPLVYEIDRRRGEFAVDEGFAAQLEAWLTDLVELTGWQPDQLWTYGTWTNGGTECSSWHNAGRAFDLARLRLADGTEVSCRYDQWRATTARELVPARRAYWALAASAHKHFAYVLTYLYDASHANHIHVDNGRSGADLSSFTSRSAAQVQSVQAICTHLWDTPVEISGRWDAATRDATRAVLADLDLGDELSDQASWAAFLTASVRRGAEPA